MSKQRLQSTIITLLVMASGVSTYAAEQADQGLVDEILAQSDVTHGVCAVLGWEDGSLSLELARRTELLIHVWTVYPRAFATTRRAIDENNLYGRRVMVERGSPATLPYADNMIDLLLAVRCNDQDLDKMTCAEVLRVLRPGGTAIVGRHESSERLSTDRLRKWAGQAKAEVRETATGLWVTLTKPFPEGIDTWSHWEHGPDNNPVSTDTVIKAPYMTQWFGLPYYIAMPAVTTAAGGRTFIAMGHIAHHEREEPWLNTLLARNGYNGTLLWSLKLPDGYLAHRSAFVATPDTFYMIDLGGTGVLMLDPQTGKTKGRIDVPGVEGEWKWIAIENGRLYALVGKEKDPPETTVVRDQDTHWSWGALSKGYYEERHPWGFGNTLLAYDLAANKPAWTHNEEKPIDSRAMVLGGGKVYLYAPEAHIRCLDAATGKIQWTNDDPETRRLIEQPGQGLGSTPGFKTTCFAVYSPKALFYEAQTRQNIVAVAPDDGRRLWHKTKTTNNPNSIYLDDKLFVGIGPGGSTLMLDPLTGEMLQDLKFAKRSCVRLTATPDSLFCRGWIEGLTRYDRSEGKIIYNGAFRPSCNDGVIASDGLLYLGPWLCDCNLSLMGAAALCSLNDFDQRVKQAAAAPRQLETGPGDPRQVEPLPTDEKDWPTYRANNQRTAASRAAIPANVIKVWDYNPPAEYQPTAPTAAGGLIFLGGSDGKVRALSAATGALKWTFLTAGPIKQPPTIWNGRAYVGSGDGYIYALEAATGRLLWRFQAAPLEHRIMVYGALCSTWPVNTGVLVEDGVAYAGAGIIDYDGTYIYALDAITGELKWKNDTSGHLDPDIRKGVSAQGILTIADGRLWLAGGNVVSPATYDLNTGKYLGAPPGNGTPQANRGEEIAVFNNRYILLGGRLQYSAVEDVVNPGMFQALAINPGQAPGNPINLALGKIPPAWNDDKIVLVERRSAQPVCCRTADLLTHLEQVGKGLPDRLWHTQWPGNPETLALALAPNAVVSVNKVAFQSRQLKPAWTVRALDPNTGQISWRMELPKDALTNGLIVDRDGRVIVALADGGLTCFQPLDKYIADVLADTADPQAGRQRAIDVLNGVLKTKSDLGERKKLTDQLAQLGFRVGVEARKDGYIANWHLLGPVPWDKQANRIDKQYIGEPKVDLAGVYPLGRKQLRWMEYHCDDPTGRVILTSVIGSFDYSAVYAYAEVTLKEDTDLLLKVGSDDGFKAWFNGREIGTFEVERGYMPGENVMPAQGKKGRNVVLLKVINGVMAWEYNAQLTDTAGKPIDLNTE